MRQLRNCQCGALAYGGFQKQWNGSGGTAKRVSGLYSLLFVIERSFYVFNGG